RGIFPNRDGAILPGYFVRIRVPNDVRKGALLVPERALGTDQSGQYLLVVGAGDIVEYRPVPGGARVGGVAVVGGEIGAGERGVVEGRRRARPKLKVIPKSEAVPRKAVAVAAPVPEAAKDGPSAADPSRP